MRANCEDPSADEDWLCVCVCSCRRDGLWCVPLNRSHWSSALSSGRYTRPTGAATTQCEAGTHGQRERQSCLICARRCSSGGRLQRKRGWHFLTATSLFLLSDARGRLPSRGYSLVPAIKGSLSLSWSSLRHRLMWRLQTAMWFSEP